MRYDRAARTFFSAICIAATKALFTSVCKLMFRSAKPV
jgi:hypothetical protein